MNLAPDESESVVSFPWPLFVAGSVLMVGLGVWFAIALVNAIPPETPDLGPAATVLPAPIDLPEFSLMDGDGAAFDRGRLIDHWSFLFFGYTYCPSICPVTLSTLAETARILEGTESSSSGAPHQVVFVSVDPERDVVERLGPYVRHFDPEFLGVTGDRHELEGLTKALGIHNHKNDAGPEGDYEVDHTASILLVNPNAGLRAIFSAPHDPLAIAEAFQKIRAFEEGG